MAHWNFWEWVAYTVVFCAAIWLATDTAIRQSEPLKIKLRGIIETQIWGFAPLVLMTVGSVIFVSRLLNGSEVPHGIEQPLQNLTEPKKEAKKETAIESKTIEPSTQPMSKIEQTPAVRAKRQYGAISNNDLRLAARELAGKIDAYWSLYHASREITEKIQNPSDKAKYEIDAEERLSREFRGELADEAVAISQEIAKRTGDPNLEIEIPAGLLSPATILGFQDDIIRASRKLP